MTFHVAPAGAGSRVSVLTQVQFTGAVAQYGRGSGIIQGVASQLIGEFAANLKASLTAAQSPAGPPAHGAESDAVQPQPISGWVLLWKTFWSWLTGRH